MTTKKTTEEAPKDEAVVDTTLNFTIGRDAESESAPFPVLVDGVGYFTDGCTISVADLSDVDVPDGMTIEPA